MSVGRPQFRPDLEGLRGLAILLVVLFHAGVSGLAGGFVGVDVFFVLSGFFITGLLLREWQDAGDIDLPAFYGRRALRLLPALLIVVLVTLALVMWLYAPIDRARIATTARAVALGSGNIEFASRSVDYFSSGENPLLHTWSLAVEEQFYFVWPLLFLLIALIYQKKFGNESHNGDIAARKQLIVGITIAGAISFVACLWLTTASQPWAFFGMPTRIWEFALGGAVALLMRDTDASTSTRAILLQIAGLIMIGIGVLTYDRMTPYPGWAALLPAFGAVALLVGGHRGPDTVISHGLSVRPLQWLGRMSYAWYLWHWPLVGLAAVIEPGIGVAGKLAWSLAALVLAWLTRKLVEQPSRDGALARIPTHWLAPSALAASVVVALIAHGAMIRAQRTASRPDQRAFALARNDRMKHDCWSNTVEDAKSPCEFGDTKSKTTLVLLGDSHAEHWLAGLDRAGKQHGWKIVAMVKGGCPVADMPELVNVRLKRYYHECTRYRAAMLQRIVALKPTAVILSSWDHYLPVDGDGDDWQVTPEIWGQGLRRTYSRLSAAHVPMISIRGTPRTWFDVPACLSRRAAGVPFAGTCEYERARALSRVAIAAQTKAARGLGVKFIDMNDQICATPRCSVVKNGAIVFTDDNHLTATFSRSVAPVLGQRVAAALE